MKWAGWILGSCPPFLYFRQRLWHPARHPSDVMPRTTYILAIVLLQLTSANAQEPDPSLLMMAEGQARTVRARDWLASREPRKVAWGAWIARLERQTAQVPSLLELVREYQPTDLTGGGWSRDQHDAMLQVLDALIELRVAVAPQDARKLYPEFPAASIILLSSTGDLGTTALSEIFDIAKGNATWLAVANLLRDKARSDFYERLFNKFIAHLQIEVVTIPRSLHLLDSPNSFTRLDSKLNWPPVGLYALTEWHRTDQPLVLLASGSTPVYYVRVEGNSYDDFEESLSGDRDTYRARFLKARLEEMGYHNLLIEGHRLVEIQWVGALAYEAELRTTIGQRLETLAVMRKLLLPRGPTQPKLEIILRDRRTDTRVPLPAPTLPEGAEFVEIFHAPRM